MLFDLPGLTPYQDIKWVLIKACNLNKNYWLDSLFNQIKLCDHKLSKMLDHMRQLLEVYDVNNMLSKAVLQKFS